MIALSSIRLLHYMEQTPDTYSYTACHIGCSSMLVEESSSPARATNSRLENTKSPITSRFFLCLSFSCTSVFSLHLREFSFSFFVASNAASRVDQQINAITGVFMNPVFSVSCSTQDGVIGWRRGIAPLRSHGTVRDTLASYGSCR